MLRGLGAHDRWVVLSCLGAALVVAVGLPLFYPVVLPDGGAFGSWLTILFAVSSIPTAAAVVAAVLTRVPWVAFGIGVVAAVVVAAVGVVSIGARGYPGVALASLPSAVIGSVVGAVPLLAADALAPRVPRTALGGALVGAAVAVLHASIPLLRLALGRGMERLGALGGGYLALEVLVPAVVVVLAGAVAGSRSAARPAG